MFFLVRIDTTLCCPFHFSCLMLYLSLFCIFFSLLVVPVVSISDTHLCSYFVCLFSKSNESRCLCLRYFFFQKKKNIRAICSNNNNTVILTIRSKLSNWTHDLFYFVLLFFESRNPFLFKHLYLICTDPVKNKLLISGQYMLHISVCQSETSFQ
jgi:hypothetical protein